MTNQATRLAEEAKRQVTAIASGLADQQAMQDDWWVNALSEAMNAIDALAALAQPAGSEDADTGPWSGTKAGNLQSADFKHDVRLGISGDFENRAERMSYAKSLAAALNSARASSTTGEQTP